MPHELKTERDIQERKIAVIESEAANAEDAYFLVRIPLDNSEHRRIFTCGFRRGYEKAMDTHPLGLTNAQIDLIAHTLPGGLDGYRKQWGWRQFARAVEAAHEIQARAIEYEPPCGENGDLP